MEHLTVRRLPAPIAKALNAERKRRGTSLNQTVIDLLSQSLGVLPASPKSNGLRRLAGRWSEEEFREFQEAIAVTEQIDEELWR